VPANREPRWIIESTPHQPLLTRPSFRSHANSSSALWAKIQAQPPPMFLRPVLECFWGRAYELNAIRGEEHPYAEGRSSSMLTEIAVADDCLKRMSMCPVSNISAQATALVKISHRISRLLASASLN